VSVDETTTRLAGVARHRWDMTAEIKFGSDGKPYTGRRRSDPEPAADGVPAGRMVGSARVVPGEVTTRLSWASRSVRFMRRVRANSRWLP
jgi:hypothetical protein